MKESDLFRAQEPHEMELPFAGDVAAGFPSPAEDAPMPSLDLNRRLVRNPASTFFMTVRGTSMEGDGIGDGDLIVIDRSIEPYDGCVAVCCLDGEFTLKRVRIFPDHALLVPSNPRYSTVRVDTADGFVVWGVVRYAIKKI